jgi:hypothetical protein
MKFVALFLLAASCLAQEIREPVVRARHPVPAYPMCGAQAVVGEPCIWQPPNLVISGNIISESGTDVLPGASLPTWFFMDTSGFPNDYHPTALGFSLTLDTMIGDCATRMSNMNVAQVSCGSFCNGNYHNDDRSPWQCTTAGLFK